MCKLLEEMRNEAAVKAKAEEKRNTALKMLARGYSAEEIAEMTGLALEAVQELSEKKNA